MSTMHMTATERSKVFEAAMGRIFRLGSRPFQEGDIEEYERCRAVIMNLAQTVPADHGPNIARDRGKGAAGQW
jgi:hypothetical protein